METVYRIYKIMNGKTVPTSYSSTNPSLINGVMKFLKRSKCVKFEIREEYHELCATP